MSLATPPPLWRKRIEDVRCPAIKGLPDDAYHMLHHSFIEIVKMRKSIESSDTHVEQSLDAIFDTPNLTVFGAAKISSAFRSTLP